MRATDAFTIEVRLGPHELGDALRADVVKGLTASPKELPPKWFYDERGCELFDEITGLPEYYPTRRETEILRREATRIARVTRAHELIELGSGSSEKTRILLDALTACGTLERYVPLDVAEAYLRAAGESIAARYSLRVHGVVGDFEHHLDDLPDGERRIIAFLGGTIGNLYPDQRARFYRQIARQMHDGDYFLLGTDLVKSRERLEAAYNDSAGVTAAFNLNMLRVLNDRLDADFDVRAFEHRAFFDPDRSWIEMRLRSLHAQTARVRAVKLEVTFAEGEEMRTEISTKFTRARVRAELAEAGLKLATWWTDAAGDYALSLSVRA
ncbi:MAG: L-histidine N(alpha)-methyltransferase [Actinomycetota bacterium]